MSDADPTTPSWAPYADGIVRRLHLTLPVADRLSSRDTFLTSPEEALPDPLPSDPLQEIVAGMQDPDAVAPLDWIDGADWGGFRSSGPRRPSVLQLQLALRLAATLSSEATPRSWLPRPAPSRSDALRFMRLAMRLLQRFSGSRWHSSPSARSISRPRLQNT